MESLFHVPSEPLPVRTIFIDVDAPLGTNAFDKTLFDAVREQKILEQQELETSFPRYVSPSTDALPLD